MDALSHDIARYGRRSLSQINYQFRIYWMITRVCGGDEKQLRGLYDLALGPGKEGCASFTVRVHADPGFRFMAGIYAYWHRCAMPRNFGDLDDIPAVIEYRRVGGLRPGAQVSLVVPFDRGHEVLTGNTGLNAKFRMSQEGTKFWLMDFRDFLSAIAADTKRQTVVDCGNPGLRNSGLDIDLDLFL